MVMVYDGVEFQHAHEVLDYKEKKWIRIKMHDAPPDIFEESDIVIDLRDFKTPDGKPGMLFDEMRKRLVKKIDNMSDKEKKPEESLSTEEIKKQPLEQDIIEFRRKAIIKHYRRYLKDGRMKLPRNTMKGLSRRLKLKPISIQTLISKDPVLKREISKIRQKSVGIESGRKADIMQRNKPITPMSYETKMTKIAEKSIGREELIFPYIYPLSDQGHQMLQSILQTISEKGGKLSYYDASHYIELQDGYSWKPSIWVDVCRDIMSNIVRICNVLGCKKDRLKICMERSKWEIIGTRN